MERPHLSGHAGNGEGEGDDHHSNDQNTQHHLTVCFGEKWFLWKHPERECSSLAV